MAYTQRFTEDAGQTLYAVPPTITTATWNALRVLCTELETGLYSVTVDETLGSQWWIYAGATVPSDWDDRIGVFGVDRTDEVIEAVEARGQVIGEPYTWTNQAGDSHTVTINEAP